jgi:hypothetical protein
MDVGYWRLDYALHLRNLGILRIPFKRRGEDTVERASCPFVVFYSAFFSHNLQSPWGFILLRYSGVLIRRFRGRFTLNG